MPSQQTAAPNPWESLPDELRARGMRWTPQRRTLIDVLSRADGHLTGAELVDRCRDADPTTTPSTVYRTLDVLEDLGLIRHAHGPAGREEFHVLPTTDHGHLHCSSCGGSWELDASEAAGLVRELHRGRGFQVSLSHVTVVGRCADCVASGPRQRA
ncbi:MAG: transcriptional repressor [Chloroflexi bacterium]|nr:transcriptional repressor [Chloroflexota bacterium]